MNRRKQKETWKKEGNIKYNKTKDEAKIEDKTKIPTPAVSKFSGCNMLKSVIHT